MGCCGCDNKGSANAAGIFAIIQCFLGIALTSVSLKTFSSHCSVYTNVERSYTCMLFGSENGSIRALLIVELVLYIFWIISSIVLLIGNAKNNYGMVRQWVFGSIIMIICDLVLPAVVMIITFRTFVDYIQQEVAAYDRRNINSPHPRTTIDITGYYLTLLFSFSRGGLITWIANIALTVFTSRRAFEIRNPPATGYVISQAGYMNPGPQPQFFQPGYPPAATQPWYPPGQQAQPYPYPPPQYNQEPLNMGHDPAGQNKI